MRKNRLNSLVEPTLTPGRDVSVEDVPKTASYIARSRREPPARAKLTRRRCRGHPPAARQRSSTGSRRLPIRPERGALSVTRAPSKIGPKARNARNAATAAPTCLAEWEALETAQDEIAEATTDPWPHQGSGTLPELCAGAARENLRSVSTCAKPMMRYFLLEYGRPACRTLRVDDDAASYGGTSGCDRPTTGEAAISTSCEVPVIGLDGLGGCPTGLRPTPGSRA